MVFEEEGRQSSLLKKSGTMRNSRNKWVAAIYVKNFQCLLVESYHGYLGGKTNIVTKAEPNRLRSVSQREHAEQKNRK